MASSISLNEERVRQLWIDHLIHHLEYPAGYLVVEQALHMLPHVQGRGRLPNRRLDLLVMAPHPGREYLWPLLMIEFKRGPLQFCHMQQVLGYNGYVQAPFLAVANAQDLRFGKADAPITEWIPQLPTYPELLHGLLQS